MCISFNGSDIYALPNSGFNTITTVNFDIQAVRVPLQRKPEDIDQQDNKHN